MKCIECGADMRLCKDPMEAVVHNEKFTVHGVEHWLCDECGEDLTDAAGLKRLADEAMRLYRDSHGLLSPEEIKGVRKSRGLNQKQFQKLLGVTSPAVSRWETGTVTQSKPIDNLIRAVGRHDCVYDELARRAEVSPVPPASLSECVNLRSLMDRSMERDGITYVS